MKPDAICTNRFVFVSTHVVCEKLSAVQEQDRLPEFLAHFAKNTNSHFDYSRIHPPNGNLARTWEFEF